MNKTSGRGRRAGSPDTQEQIREAARLRFLAEGYQSVTMRSIAADAGVDVALVSYYFGSKQGLFGAAMALPANPANLFQDELDGGPLETLGERVLRTLLTVWDDPNLGAPLRAIASTATTDPGVGRLVREAVAREIVERLAERLGGPNREQRAAAFTSQIAGVLFTRYLLGFEPIASMSRDDVVLRLAPALQLALLPAPPRRAKA